MKKLLLAFGFSLIVVVSAIGQTISGGVINTYAVVTSVNLSSVTVIGSAGFSVGEKVLIIEMQGATVNQTNTANFGNITSYGNAGNYEFDTIASIGGNLISFTHDLCKTYDVPGNVQLVSVPVYANPTITGTLTCQPWNGSTGGILIFQATGTVTMNANIDVSKFGFRGGNFESDLGNFNCADANYYSSAAPSTGDGGQKGESISVYITNEDGSQGKQANGGGGGNPGNSGGGGGGNFGAGGLGGYEWNGCSSTSIFGEGGLALSNANNKIFMGGGGGGGYADNGLHTTAGGNGGAIVYIIANTLIGNSNSIADSGQSVLTYSDAESSGGAGAGGSVIFNIQNYSGSLNINTNGGFGGSDYNMTIWTTYCHGPGGGGSGGLLWVNGNSLSPNITYTSQGGVSGLVLNPLSSCYNTSFGATKGDDGGILTNLPQFHGTPYVSIGKDITLCFGKSVLLNATDTFASYLWQDSSTNYTFNANTTGKYYVAVIDSFGCRASDTVKVKVENPIIFSLGNDTSICQDKQLLLHAPIGYVSYLWQNNSTNSTFTTSVAGTYYVTITDSFGCMGSDTMLVAIYPKPLVNIGKDTILCPPGATIVLNTKGGFKNYLWQNGSTDSAITVSTIGEYKVTVTDTNGCIASDSILINPCTPEIHLPDAFTPGAGGIDAYFIGYGNDITEYDLKIFNRWGELIFETHDINNGWDGRYNGLPEPIGVYVYEVQYSSTDKITRLQKGNITLLR
jgi:gliding motility-associated-like protein